MLKFRQKVYLTLPTYMACITISKINIYLLKKQLVSTVEHTNSKLRSPKIEGKNQEKTFEKF